MAELEPIMLVACHEVDRDRCADMPTEPVLTQVERFFEPDSNDLSRPGGPGLLEVDGYEGTVTAAGLISLEGFQS